MFGSPSSSAPASGPKVGAGQSDRGDAAGSLARPAAQGPLGARLAGLLARVPMSPGRLLALGVAGVVAVVVALWLLRPPPPAIETTLPRANASNVSSPVTAGGAVTAPSTTRSSVVVDAAGAVRRPGVYRVRAGARVDDLIRAAGGLSAGADRDRLNLAAPLVDGQRVFVPKIGELSPPPLVEPSGGAGNGGAGGGGTPTSTVVGSPGLGATGPDQQIDLNTATVDQLDALPGVGPATATAILAYRTEHGRFRSVDELLEVRGIGDAKLAALRAKVRV